MFKFKILDHKMKFLNKNCFPRKKVSRICLIFEKKFFVSQFEKIQKMEQEKSNTNSPKESNVSKKYSKTSLLSKTISKTSLMHKVGFQFALFRQYLCIAPPTEI